MAEYYEVLDYMFRRAFLFFPKRTKHIWESKFDMPGDEFLDYYWPNWKEEAPKVMRGQLLRLGIRE